MVESQHKGWYGAKPAVPFIFSPQPGILKAVTENLTFGCMKALYDIPCERDVFYDRRRKFYWVLDRVR